MYWVVGWVYSNKLDSKIYNDSCAREAFSISTVQDNYVRLVNMSSSSDSVPELSCGSPFHRPIDRNPPTSRGSMHRIQGCQYTCMGKITSLLNLNQNVSRYVNFEYRQNHKNSNGICHFVTKRNHRYFCHHYCYRSSKKPLFSILFQNYSS